MKRWDFGGLQPFETQATEEFVGGEKQQGSRLEDWNFVET